MRYLKMHLEPLTNDLKRMSKLIKVKDDESVNYIFIKSGLSQSYKLVSVSDGFHEFRLIRKRRIKLAAKIVMGILWAIFIASAFMLGGWQAGTLIIFISLFIICVAIISQP